MTADPVVLALDIGTSSTRALLVNRRGRSIAGAESQIAFDLTATSDGGAMLDADQLFEHVLTTIDVTQRRADGPIAAVGISCFWHSLLGLDADGKPVTPVYLWADTRSRFAVDDIRRKYDPHELWARTGCFLHSSYWPGKLRWLREAEPRQVCAVRTWCAFSDYLLRRLVGFTETTVSMASATAMMNSATLAWDDLAVQAAGVDPATLPLIAPRTERLGPVAPSFAARWPNLAQTPWFAGFGDGACANIGSGGVGPHRIALTIGTSGAVRMVGPWQADHRTSRDLWTYRVDRERAVIGAAISNGGKAVEWLAELTGGQIGDEVWSEAAGLPPDGHGLTILPFLAGERAPIWNDWATGAVIGMRLATTPAQLLQACMEAVTWRLALLYRDLVPEADQKHEIVANGGAILRSPAWLRLMADALGHPIVALAPSEEASARGAALLALEAVGIIDTLSDADDPAADGTVIEFDPARTEVYRHAIERQNQLVAALYDEAGRPRIGHTP